MLLLFALLFTFHAPQGSATHTCAVRNLAELLQHIAELHDPPCNAITVNGLLGTLGTVEFKGVHEEALGWVRLCKFILYLA